MLGHVIGGGRTPPTSTGSATFVTQLLNKQIGFRSTSSPYIGTLRLNWSIDISIARHWLSKDGADIGVEK
jgi:hypothetical protein